MSFFTTGRSVLIVVGIVFVSRVSRVGSGIHQGESIGEFGRTGKGLTRERELSCERANQSWEEPTVMAMVSSQKCGY